MKFSLTKKSMRMVTIMELGTKRYVQIKFCNIIHTAKWCLPKKLAAWQFNILVNKLKHIDNEANKLKENKFKKDFTSRSVKWVLSFSCSGVKCKTFSSANRKNK